MHIAVPTETSPGELRVAITPDSVARLGKAGHVVRVQAGAGRRAGFPDASYEAVGATVAQGSAVYEGAELVCRVQPPSADEIVAIPQGAALLSLLKPGRNSVLLDTLARRGVTALALELVPRITRAQSMDVLSSQSTVAGYKAVLIGAAALPKFLPMITTAQIPGKPAPKLITADMVASMRPGAVIVDLAAESGGNCELTLAGETVQSGTTTIIGPVNVPATVPFHASQMFGKNVLALVTHLSTKEGALSIDPTDEITGAMTVVRDGSVVART